MFILNYYVLFFSLLVQNFGSFISKKGHVFMESYCSSIVLVSLQLGRNRKNFEIVNPVRKFGIGLGSKRF